MIPDDTRLPYAAVIGGVEHRTATRSGALRMLTHEIDNWAEHARRYEGALLPKLQALKGEIEAASRTADWEVPLPYGMRGTLGYRRK